MNQAVVSDWRGPKARRRMAILGGSLAFHGVVLALIGLGLIETRMIAPDLIESPMTVELMPRPLLPGEVARRAVQSAPVASEVRAAAQTAAQAEAPASLNPVETRPRDEGDDRPSPPAPRVAAAPAPGIVASQASGTAGSAPAAGDRWTVRPPDLRGAIARSFRLGAAGCRTLDGQLSEAEQRICDDNFNEAAGRARPIGPRTLNASETRREEQFAREGAAAMARYERRRAPMRSGVGVVGIAPECPGGNLRGTCPGANLPSQYQHQEENPFGGSAGPK